MNQTSALAQKILAFQNDQIGEIAVIRELAWAEHLSLHPGLDLGMNRALSCATAIAS
jgi:hypothetical protein